MCKELEELQFGSNSGCCLGCCSSFYLFLPQKPIVYHWLGVWEYLLSWKATLISCSGTYPERTSNFCVHPSSSSIKLASAVCSKTTYAVPANRLLSP